jgi:hypothetical protein
MIIFFNLKMRQEKSYKKIKMTEITQIFYNLFWQEKAFQNLFFFIKRGTFGH